MRKARGQIQSCYLTTCLSRDEEGANEERARSLKGSGWCDGE
jgi:hypothetical protein